METQQSAEGISFAQWLKKSRIARGITQRELARLSGLSSAMITRLESGDVGHTRATIEKLAQALAPSPESIPAYVAAAKAASAGLPAPNPTLEAIAFRLSQLSEQDQARVLDMIERLLVPQESQRREIPVH